MMVIKLLLCAAITILVNLFIGLTMLCLMGFGVIPPSGPPAILFVAFPIAIAFAIAALVAWAREAAE